MKQDARYTAAQALMRLEGQNAYSNLLLEGLVRQNHLDAREAAFASALFYTALERLLNRLRDVEGMCAGCPRT